MNKGNHILDHLARTRIRVHERHWPAFQVCGYTGVLLAIVLAMTLVSKTGLSFWMMGVIAISAMATFLSLVFVTKVITGEGQIIYYHHEIAVMLGTALVVKALHRPVLPYLDITILGIGLFLACGRIGCLMVGCCHGRPFGWGIRYRDEHAQEGFAPYLVGVRLFPIQAVESFWVIFVVICGAMFVLEGRPAGTALAWYTIAYGAARFSFEFIRGDTERPYTFGFSQGQWLSLWLMSALLWGEGTGRIQFQSWHALTLAALVAIMALVTLYRKFDSSRRFKILHPQHACEVAGALKSLSTNPQAQSAECPTSPDLTRTPVACTSLGIQISGSRTGDKTKAVDHYTLSQRSHDLNKTSALLLARLIQELKREPRTFQLLAGEHGTFHLVLPHKSGNGAAA